MIFLFDEVYMFVFFPWGPNKTSVWKVFLWSLLPPVPSLNHLFDNVVIIALTNIKFGLEVYQNIALWKLDPQTKWRATDDWRPLWIDAVYFLLFGLLVLLSGLTFLLIILFLNIIINLWIINFPLLHEPLLDRILLLLPPLLPLLDCTISSISLIDRVLNLLWQLQLHLSDERSWLDELTDGLFWIVWEPLWKLDMHELSDFKNLLKALVFVLNCFW